MSRSSSAGLWSGFYVTDAIIILNQVGLLLSQLFMKFPRVYIVKIIVVLVIKKF